MRVERMCEYKDKDLPVEVNRKKVRSCYLINVAHKLHTHTPSTLVLPVFATTYDLRMRPWPLPLTQYIHQIKLGIHYKHRNKMYT
jgi:hypothetical protein